MKQIYDFEAVEPPLLNESILRQKAKQKQTDRQIALLAAASILSLLVVTLLGLAAAPFYPTLAFLFFAYVIMTAVGSGVAAIIYSERRRCFA